MYLMSPVEYPLPPTDQLSPYSSIPHPGKLGYVTPLSPLPSDSEDAMTLKIVWRTPGYSSTRIQRKFILGCISFLLAVSHRD